MNAVSPVLNQVEEMHSLRNSGNAHTSTFVEKGMGTVRSYRATEKTDTKQFDGGALHAIEPNGKGCCSCLIEGERGRLAIRVQAGSTVKLNEQTVSIPETLPPPRVDSGYVPLSEAILVV